MARGRLTFRLCKKIFQGSQVTRTADKKKNSCQTILSKIKSHLKLSSKSVGQGRGGLEGTARPSQLRAGSPLKKKFLTKPKNTKLWREVFLKTTRPSVSNLSSRTQCGDLGFCHYERSEVIQKQVLLVRRLLSPRHKCGSWQAHI